MKQLLLRVDDELHARLSERAKREHRSVNAIANEILSVVREDDRRSLEERVKARAAALGVLATPLRPVEKTEDIDALRARAIESMRGAGRILDAVLDEDRDRLDRLCRFLTAGARLPAR
ncbi:FitA-like ribbon-helix-helix domain-containing protein [Glycomyces arizonensis]|uniref:FitA-like ribbon-helix-helix domain-containing protein n=1 Tax=Glycomyces arizonensis TaxID=256035 RepID=UPI0012EB3F43|nr:toxin-antitoxin system HicB family antitoxin [Glycomyces arizonensis]